MSTNKLNGVVVGYGGMGGFHVSHLQKSDVANLLGVFDIKESRHELARERGINTYESFEAVLNDKNVDFITIATPNDVHKEIAIAAMAAGKHVISEKPVTVSSVDLQEMIDASKKYNRIFTTHQNRRWDGDFLTMRDLYNSNELGEVFGIESRVLGSRGIPGDWRGKKEFGGGMMLDWGVHLIDQILQIVKDKKIERIYCRFDHITNYEVDDGFKLDIYFEKELTARIEVGTSHFIPLSRYFMTGTNGSANIAWWGADCEVVSCKHWDEKNVVPVVTAAGLTKTMAPRDEKTIEKSAIPCPTSDVHDFYRNFVKAVRGEEKQIVTHEELMRVMKVMEACFVSDETGLPVDFNDEYFGK